MSLLVVGSVALDSVETPFGTADEVVGGSGTFFAASASHYTPVRLVGVVGSDYPVERLQPLAARGVDLSGLETASGESFRWRGRYRHDLNVAETLETRLGVFAGFEPKIPASFRESKYVFLANIHPALQHAVLDQVSRPALVACDTMNLWIETQRNELVRLLGRVDLITLNDGEARQLTGSPNLLKAARWILDQGPKYVIIKKGEHGALMFTGASVFFAPAYPLEQIFDPTGAGDSFAGGFMGWVAKTDDVSERNFRRAVVYGSAMGSFAVERFSIDRLLEVGQDDIAARVKDFHALVSLDGAPQA
ncbi:MAG TPA: PfkB family carbohydrate kinase [Gemmatimonadaceae bacterium]|nr:PfkB family carbohydrate kinase [Gemmatimonadaceae bacterium]